MTSRRRRPYDSPLRREQAEATRERVASAAREVFLARGWTGTRIRDVADAAGVSPPTVYAAYGNKAGLAHALVDSVESQADVSRMLAELRTAEGDPRGQLRAMVSFDRRLFETCGELITVLRDALRSEPDLATAYREGRRRGEATRQRVFRDWPVEIWQEGVGPDRAVDIYAALCNVEVFHVLVSERGWSPQEVEDWWHSSLVALLCNG